MSDPKVTVEYLYPTKTRALGAVLSFLAPGLGHIYQGLARRDRNRLTKGLFFLVTLWGMFFYGMYLGKWRNVYLPHVQEHLVAEEGPNSERAARVFGRLLPAFPGDVYTRLQYAGQFWIGAAAWPALWNYFCPDLPIFGSFQASPGSVPKGQEDQRRQSLERAERELMDLQLDPEMGKLWDIAWIYTVIAGVLNILVIYDAWSGPVRVHKAEEARKGVAA